MGATEQTAADGGTGARVKPGRWRRRRLVVAVLLLAVAMAAGLLALLPAYRVRTSDAVTWYGEAINQSYPRGTEVTVTLSNPFRHDLASAEVVVQGWSDDAGRDLLIRQVPAGHYRGDYGYHDSVSSANASTAGGGVTAARPKNVSPSELTWTLTTPVRPSPDARSVRVTGKVLITEGHDPKTEAVKSFDWRPGSVLRVGRDAWTVRSAEKESPRSQRIVLSSDGLDTPAKKVRFLDAGGRETTSGEEFHEWGIQGRRTVTPAATRPPVYYMDLVVPTDSAAAAGCEVEYWSRLRRREVALAATLPLERKDAGGSLGPAEVAVPESAWGPKAEVPPQPQDLFDVRPLGVDLGGGDYPYWEATLELDFRHPGPGETIASYAPLLTGCRDSDGNVLLGSAPFASGVYEGWGLWQEFRRKPQAAGGAVFTVMGNRMPSPSAKALLLQGQVRVKVGRDPKPVEAKNVSLTRAAPAFALGPVTFTYSRDMSDGVELFTRGDLGLLGDVSVSSPEGKVLSTLTSESPQLYWSDASVCYLDLKKDAPRTGLTLRGTYLSATRYYTFPFSVTVPLDRRPGRPGSTAPTDGR